MTPKLSPCARFNACESASQWRISLLDWRGMTHRYTCAIRFSPEVIATAAADLASTNRAMIAGEKIVNGEVVEFARLAVSRYPDGDWNIIRV